VSNPFFLTRQTAKLMEDFDRELKAGASVFLLYGDNDVGKTRLLEELNSTRLADSKVHWIDLKAGGSGDGALVDSSAMVEDVFAKAQPGEVVIADHFEMALQKTRHQLFLSWSTDGVDKQINLIISSNARFFDELRQLAAQYQVAVQSFQLISLSPEESSAFLGSYLFPDRPIGKLSIPVILQDQLAMTNGAVGKIVEIAERAGDQITSAPLDDSETIRKDSKNIVAVLIGLALVIGVAWYYLSSRTQTDEVGVAEVETVAAPAATTTVEAAESISPPATSQPVAGEEESDPGVTADEADASSEVTVVDAVAVEETVAVDEPAEESAEEPVEGESEMVSEAGTATDEEAVLVGVLDPPVSEQSPDTVADEVPPEAVAANIEVASTPAAEPMPASGVSRFDSELQTSLDWINRSDSKVGTIQILILSYDRFDERTYYEYIEYLASRGVDITELKTFMTYTGGRKVYSVVYGEYESWQAASDAIEGLPKVLRDTSPIPRSSGGLMQEIRRLEARN
jgi:septal ring-binding cell division protein DamX